MSTVLNTKQTDFRGRDRLNLQPAFESLFEKYAKAVYYFFLRRGFSHEESQEMAQETFYRSYRGLKRANQGSDLKAWLFTIAANVRRNEIRHRKAEKRDVQEISLDGLVEGGRELRSQAGNDPLKDTLENDRSRRLYSAVGELPDQMRRCLVLRIIHELKYEEIATVMQVSVNTVKSQLFQARRRLQMQLG